MARSNVGGMGDYTIAVQEENERDLVQALVDAKCLHEALQDDADAQMDMVDLLSRQLDQVRADLKAMRMDQAKAASKGKSKSRKGGR